MLALTLSGRLKWRVSVHTWFEDGLVWVDDTLYTVWGTASPPSGSYSDARRTTDGLSHSGHASWAVDNSVSQSSH